MEITNTLKNVGVLCIFHAETNETFGPFRTKLTDNSFINNSEAGVRQEVNNLGSLVVVQELELAINCAFYSL